ncbi:MAG: hypothetical protein Kow0097_11030 [Candidatus Bipolaricaulota bacterium]
MGVVDGEGNGIDPFQVPGWAYAPNQEARLPTDLVAPHHPPRLLGRGEGGRIPKDGRRQRKATAPARADRVRPSGLAPHEGEDRQPKEGDAEQPQPTVPSMSHRDAGG